ncbi:MAG: hypothetical protein SVY41_02375 [Candidatus Nanohaloarchaea archaeon]|nr:hypothetical protein [Candidatus Nanohaloarchaea archaeon]
MTTDTPVHRLPSLDTGITHLNTDTHATSVIQSLALNHLITYAGTARWIDSKGHARTDTMHRLAPNPRLLEKIQVARAFTPQQHLALIEHLTESVDEETTLIVLPDVNSFYADDDLMTGKGEEMLHTALQTLHNVIEDNQVPALITTQRCGEALHYVAESYADTTVSCRMTEHGPYFSSDTFETLVYPGNGYVQTTLTLFQALLRERYEQVSVEDGAEVVAHG